MFYMYILQSEVDNGFYIGYTSNLEERLKQHNQGKTRSLKHRIPMKVAYYEEFNTKKEAKQREKQVKSWKGGNAFKNLLKGSPRL